VTLSWTASENADGYDVSRATTSGGPYAAVGSATTESLTDTGLSAGTRYFYVVQARQEATFSERSNEVVALTLPGAPEGLQTSVSAGDVTLDWADLQSAETYAVFRSDSQGGPYTQIGSPQVSTYVDPGLPPNTNRFYVVRGANPSGLGETSAEVSALGLPAVPSNLQLVATGTQVSASWTAVAGATTYLVQRSTTTGGPYTTVATPSSAAYVDTALTPSTEYFYVVRATSSAGTGAPSAEASVILAPPIPTGLAAVSSGTQVALTWTAVGSASSYVVLRGSTSGGPYTQVGTPVGNGYTDTALSSNTSYFYVVRSSGPGGVSGNSSQASATTPPAPPTGLGATSSPTQVSLSWTASTGATSYVVLRGTVTGGPYTQIATPSVTNSADTSIAANTAYFYVVRAVGPGGTSGNSAEASATTPPLAPTFSSLVSASTQITASWNAPSGANSYALLRSTTSGGPYTQVATTLATSHVDTGLSADTVYYYVVRAVSGAGTSPNSTEGTARTPPGAPTGVGVSLTGNDASVSWTAPSGATSFVVLRGTVSGGPYSQVGTSTGSPFSDPGLAAGTTYYYVVRAVGVGGTGPNSSQVSATTPPSPPTGLTGVTGHRRVNLSWNASTGATTYNVYRANAALGPFTQIATGVAAAAYLDTGLTAYSTYFYNVEAVNTEGTSGASSTLSVTPGLLPPTGVFAVAVGSVIQLQWDASTGATGYVVQETLTSGSGYNQVASTTSNRHTRSGVATSTDYFYVIRSEDPDGQSAPSTEILVRTSVGTELCVQNTSSTGSVAVFPVTMTTGAQVALRTFGGGELVSSTGFDVDVDNAETLATNAVASSFVYDTNVNAGVAVRTLSGSNTSLDTMGGAAFDVDVGYQYLASQGQIWVFSNTANGNATPVRSWTTGGVNIVVDRLRSEIYTSTINTVSVWDRSATGNALPLRTGSVTANDFVIDVFNNQLIAVTDVAVDFYRLDNFQPSRVSMLFASDPGRVTRGVAYDPVNNRIIVSATTSVGTHQLEFYDPNFSGFVTPESTVTSASLSAPGKLRICN
jgi:fibronectin type 3 domain-containing protein